MKSFILFMMLLGVYQTIPSTFASADAANPVVLRYAQDDLGSADVNTSDFNLQGNSVTVTKNTAKGLVMTTGAGQASSVFLKEQLAADASKPGFSTYFVMNVYRLNPGPADGYVFIIAANSNSLGESGGGLGYSGITNSLGIEFDFYNNGGENIASSDVFVNGTPFTTAGTVFDSGYLTRWNNVASGALVRAFHTWIEYDHIAGRLELRVALSNNESASTSRPQRPSTPLLTRNATYNQISNFFYAGFTAATGGQMQQMTLKSWYMSNAYIAGGINPDADTITIDATPPSEPTLSTTQTGENYTMSISGGSDDTGVAGYQYKMPSGDWTNYTSPVAMNTLGLYQARTVDVAGNYSTSVASVSLYGIQFSAGGVIRSTVKRSSLDSEFTINYTFDDGTNLYFDWYDNSSFTGTPITTLAPRSTSITLYGQPVQNVFRIDYVLDGGFTSESNPEFYVLGEALNIVDAQKEGHTFVGWFLDQQGTIPFNTESIPEENFTLYAIFSLNQYTVSIVLNNDAQDVFFDSFGHGTSLESITETYEILIQQGSLTKEGHALNGWTTDAEGQVPVTSQFMLTQTETLYAQWTIQSYDVVFLNHDGSTYATSTFEYDQNVTFPAAPERYGFTFTGWSINDTLFIEGTQMPSQSMTLQAQYDRNTYSLSFNHGNGETSSVSNLPFETVIDDYVPTNLTYEGYTFQGWYVDATFEQAYIQGSTLQATTTLFGQWTINTYTVSFVTAGGSSIEAITQDFNSELVFPANPTKEGHSFVGWYEDESYAQPVEAPFVVPANDLTLYAKWSINTYTLSFDTDGGSLLESIDLAFDTALPALPTPTKTGHTFVGWHAHSTSTTLLLPMPLSMPAMHVTMVAQWSINSYTLTFETNGGSPIPSLTQPYLSDVKAPLSPSKTGHTFIGWYLDEALTSPYSFTTMPSFDLTLYARWTVNAYTISFQSNEGSYVESLVYDYDSTLSPLPTPLRDGHTFLGWTLDEAGLIPFQATQMPEGDVLLFAQWQINTYTLTLASPHLDTPYVEIKVTFGETPFLPIPPVREGYVFAGWESNGLIVTPETFTMPSNDVTWNAVWTPLQSTILFVSNDQTTILTLTSGEAIGSLPDVPIKAGYIFLGWSLSPHDATQLIDETYVVPNGQTIRLYPIWEKTNDASILFSQFVSLTSQSIQSYTYEIVVFSTTMVLGLALMIAYRKRVHHAG